MKTYIENVAGIILGITCPFSTEPIKIENLFVLTFKCS
jgi:hypothetical protein